MVKIQDKGDYDRACEKMRFFDIDGKPCRLLPFDKDLLGTNRAKIADHNIFVKNIPEDHLRGELETFFSKYGKVKSSKISINAPKAKGDPYTSRGYGFVCFESAESAEAAVVDNEDGKNKYSVQRYKPTDRNQLRKSVNNIYVKNFPLTWDEAKLKEVFG